jgi:hypothetical protein
MYLYIPVRTSTYSYVLILDVDWPLQHAHIDNIKSVANLSNNKDVFMCILRFHARAGYLQHYEAAPRTWVRHLATTFLFYGCAVTYCYLLPSKHETHIFIEDITMPQSWQTLSFTNAKQVGAV